MAKHLERVDGEDPADSPVAWFAVLDRARCTHDFELAAQAQRELDRLGVMVQFTRPMARRRKRDGDD